MPYLHEGGKAAGKATPNKDMPTATSIVYIEVENLDLLYKELIEKGVKFLAEPKEQGWGGKTAIMLDPDKNILVLSES